MSILKLLHLKVYLLRNKCAYCSFKVSNFIVTVFTIGHSSLRLDGGVLHVLGWRGRATRVHLKLRVVQLCVCVCVYEWKRDTSSKSV